MTTQTGGDLLAEALIAQGVTTIFGIPGVQLDGATDALYSRTDKIAFICARNEQATTYMADGYSRSTGDVGVAMVVPGPGVLNALAGLATAYATNSRVLLLAGQINSAAIGRGLGALHEIPDQTGIVARLSKWNGLATSAAEIPSLVERAFRELRTGRPRPVVLELPPDVLAQVAEAAIPAFVPQVRAEPAVADVERAAALLSAASRPLIFVGGGVLASGASEALTQLAERLNAPVLVSENGRGAIDARHRLAFDALAIRKLRADADVVLAVGTRFMSTFGSQIDAGDADLILVNADAADLGAPRNSALAIEADARAGMEAITRQLGAGVPADRTAELDKLRDWVAEQLEQIAPQREFHAVIRAALPDDGVFVSEFTQIGYAASMSFPTYSPGAYIGPGYQGTLGFGFATALGVKAADPDRVVISVNGDGGFAWTMQELSTARKYDLGLVTIVFNDGHFGNVRRIQKNDYDARYFASELTNPNYGMLAAAFGIEYAIAFTPKELAGVLAVAVTSNAPILIEVPVGEFPSPWNLIHEGIPVPPPVAPLAHVVPRP